MNFVRLNLVWAWDWPEISTSPKLASCAEKTTRAPKPALAPHTHTHLPLPLLSFSLLFPSPPFLSPPTFHLNMPITTKAEAEALTVVELKTELEARGLATEGIKVRALELAFALSTNHTQERRYQDF